MRIHDLARALSSIVLALAVVVVPSVAEAQTGRIARAAERSIVRGVSRLSVSRTASRTIARPSAMRTLSTLARDRRNHDLARVMRLPASRTVSRYTTLARARGELRRGVPPMRHLTSRGGPGRPWSSATAARTLGLARKPAARLTIRVPKGQPVLLNRIPGGAPGRGELVSPKRIPPSAVNRLVVLSK